MSGKVYGIGDLHLGHINMAKKRGFNSVEEHDNFIISQWNSVVTKRDTVYILGDVTMETTKWYWLLDKMLGFKKVVLGNHDMPQHAKHLLNYVNNVSSSIKYEGWILTHIPIHESEINRFRGNIHAHTHEDVINDCRYICLSAEQISYKPVELKRIVDANDYLTLILKNKYTDKYEIVTTILSLEQFMSMYKDKYVLWNVCKDKTEALAIKTLYE